MHYVAQGQQNADRKWGSGAKTHKVLSLNTSQESPIGVTEEIFFLKEWHTDCLKNKDGSHILTK